MCAVFLEYSENARQKRIPRTSGRVMRMVSTGDHRPDGFTV